LLGLALAGCGTPAASVGAPPASVVTPPLPSLHLSLGQPRDQDPSDDVILDHGVFVVSYNPARLGPNWVAWRLVASDLGDVDRTDFFHSDPLLPAGMPGPTKLDYRNSGYDRGHLCPSGDRTASVAANEETFVMTNMEPQVHALNVGPWEKLETFERQLAREDRQIFLVAGGLFDAAPTRLAGGEAVPRASFKVMVVLERGTGAGAVNEATTTFAVIMPNTEDVARTDWSDYLVSIDEVERQSGYDFLSLVAPGVQRGLEARVAPPPARRARRHSAGQARANPPS
jgi:endonuclease G